MKIRKGMELVLASAHLGFHEEGLPLLCGHRHPFLLLPKIFLLGE